MVVVLFLGGVQLVTMGIVGESVTNSTAVLIFKRPGIQRLLTRYVNQMN